MKGEAANQALRDINHLLATSDVGEIELKDSRVDHTRNMSPFHVSVVFNEKCFKKILAFNNATSNTLVEYGTFFYGRIKGNTLYIEDYKSDFARCDGVFVDDAVCVTERNMFEKIVLTEKTKKNPNPYNVVVHFHTHPAYGITENYEAYKTCTTRYSDQDLYSYGYLQKYRQPKSENIIIYLGGLLAVDDGRTQISMVYYDPKKKDFYNVSNIYYMCNGNLIKFNNYDITRSKKIEDTSGIRLMKELKDN